MDFKFTVKLDNKLHKGALHNLTAPALTLTLKNIFYRHYKTDDISIPYIGETQIEDFKASGYLELVGVVIDGELMESIRINKGEAKG